MDAFQKEIEQLAGMDFFQPAKREPHPRVRVRLLAVGHLQNHTYLYTKDIIAYVKATFGIVYTVPGMTGWLKMNDFLKLIEGAYLEAVRVHVFCDNAKYYRNKLVQDYLGSSKIKMHFLPPYSPNLNPIERLWKFMNEKVLDNKYYEKFVDFKGAVFGFFEQLRAPPDDLLEALIRRITDKFRVVGKVFPTVG